MPAEKRYCVVGLLTVLAMLNRQKLSCRKRKYVWQTLLVDVVQIPRIVLLIYSKGDYFNLSLLYGPKVIHRKLMVSAITFIKFGPIGKWHYLPPKNLNGCTGVLIHGTNLFI